MSTLANVSDPESTMNQPGYQSTGSRIRIFDPPIMTLVVYGGLFAVYQIGELNTPLGRMLLIPALLGLLIVPIVTARSLGHTLMSSLGGGRLLRFTSGPFLLDRVGDSLKPGFNTRWARYPGSAITSPLPGADLRKWVRWRETGSFIGMVAYVLLVLLISNWLRGQSFIVDSPETARMVETIAFGISVLVITLGVWQLVNRHIPRIWRMSRKNQSADREAAIIAMTSLILVGQRPRDWPAEWPDVALWDEDESIEGLYGYRFAYLYALDSGDFEAADRYFQYLDEHADRLPNRMREHIVDLERPFVEAWIRGNPETARELMDNLGNRIVDRHRIRRVQAAVFLAEGETQVAREYAVEGLNASAGKLHDGEVIAEAAVLEEILQRTGGDVGAINIDDEADETKVPERETAGEAASRQ
jgi:hypothetical protein